MKLHHIEPAVLSKGKNGKRGATLAVTAFAACAVCCALPLVSVATLASTIAGVLAWISGTPLWAWFSGLLAVVAVGALVALRHRRKCGSGRLERSLRVPVAWSSD